MALTTFIVAYDITNDSRRARIAALLQAHGDRIQKSVFLLVVADDDLPELRAQIAIRIEPSHDSVYLARQCGTCFTALECHGQAHPPEQQLFWAVL